MWSAILAVQIIHNDCSQQVDLWMLHRNTKLQCWLQQQPCIRKVFISPQRDIQNYSPCYDGSAIPVYGRYDLVIHLGDLTKPVDSTTF